MTARKHKYNGVSGSHRYDVAVSTDGGYLTEAGLSTLRRGREPIVVMNLQTHLGKVPTGFYEVSYGDDHYFADAKTGTLYFQHDGRSVGSGHMRISVPARPTGRREWRSPDEGQERQGRQGPRQGLLNAAEERG